MESRVYSAVSGYLFSSVLNMESLALHLRLLSKPGTNCYALMSQYIFLHAVAFLCGFAYLLSSIGNVRISTAQMLIVAWASCIFLHAVPCGMIASACAQDGQEEFARHLAKESVSGPLFLLYFFLPSTISL